MSDQKTLSRLNIIFITKQSKITIEKLHLTCNGIIEVYTTFYIIYK